jgi:hypothetical protein
VFSTLPAASAPVLSAWSHFQAAARDDKALLIRLRRIAGTPDFIGACLDAASARGIALCEGHVYAAISDARRHWLQRHISSPSSQETAVPPPAAAEEIPPPDWLPIHLPPASPTSSGSPQLDWAHFGDLRLTDPFFEQTVGAALRPPAAILFRDRCTIDHLETKLGSAAPELPPAGFVFHLSRCGSTLFAQVLAASPRHRVLSEVPPIDQLLAHDLAAGLPRARRVARLRALVNACARRRFPEERHLFIKWDAWHTLHLDIIQEAFPDTPWIYLHRDPVEILVSQRRQRGYQFLPGMMNPALFGIAPAELPQLDFDVYAARVLGAAAAAAVRALALPGHRGLAVEYSTLRDKLPSLLRHHFGLRDCDEAEQAAMQAAAARNAKNPALPFAADGEEKRRQADDSLRALADRWLGESRRALLAPL